MTEKEWSTFAGHEKSTRALEGSGFSAPLPSQTKQPAFAQNSASASWSQPQARQQQQQQQQPTVSPVSFGTVPPRCFPSPFSIPLCNQAFDCGILPLFPPLKHFHVFG
jgi:hypothetical protein